LIRKARCLSLSADEFCEWAMTNPINAELLSRLASLSLNQCYLTAGCLFQAVWNRISGKPAGWGVKDYDVFYFDDHDLSWAAEDAVIQRVRKLSDDLGVTVEVKNQARVHLWYEQRFGSPYPRLGSSRDGIDRYLIACTCVGIDVASGELYAPNGLQDLVDGILRINPLNRHPGLFRTKAEDYRKRWPWLAIAETASG
jgi:hypothetical protein